MPEVVREHPDAGWAGFFYPTHPPPPEPNITNASNATVFFWSAEPNATNASNATVPSPAGKEERSSVPEKEEFMSSFSLLQQGKTASPRKKKRKY